ncbi:MAG TPA: hypothetical protein VFO82_12715 [Steroidobacteraceae bacterium]|nr:hypothetical protein [Steroidobacteraceae bacterium]
MNALWFKYVRAVEIGERLQQWLRPRRTRRVPYSWPLAPDVCPCDLDFCVYLRERAPGNQSIFHFGTGGHHVVGLQNAHAVHGNQILAITASPGEYRRYQRLLARDPALGLRYRVMLGDIYALAPQHLPEFDLVSLFHLCEFTPRSAAAHLLDDRGLLELMLARLARGGRLLFYTASNGWRRSAALLQERVAAGVLELEENFRSLQIYRRAQGRTSELRAAGGSGESRT